MKRFADLIDRLIYTRSRNAKLAAIADYLRSAPDPDRGWALAALTDSLDFPAVKSSTIRKLAATRTDPELFRLSRHHVGDTAETVALLWQPRGAQKAEEMSLDMVVTALAGCNRISAPEIVADLLDKLDSESRYAMLKLATGGMRIGVSARLAKTAFAQAFDVPLERVEEYWHALTPPYGELFTWADEGGIAPDLSATAFFRPFMLSNPLGDETVDLNDYAAEWKWDGIRVQIVHLNGETRLFSRGGDDISAAFPDIIGAIAQNGVVDGELLVRGEGQGGGAASFNALQQRLGRKSVSNKMLNEYPAFVRLYDILVDGDNDIRHLAWTDRRRRLEAFTGTLAADRFDLSPVIEADNFASLAKMRDAAREAAIEGVMLKRRDSPYIQGRKAGLWYKWKRDPLTADCVMMYAQRGNGRRASFYSDYTFGCWDENGQLLPVGKAYSGFTDEELKWLDRFVREHSIARFGPVREVEKKLVLEIAFDSIHSSKRHKSGVAMRFPRVHRIRKDKPAQEADQLKTLKNLIS
ncbi:cisplatin damage response ATP-dependent DNA ligase [Sphingorhabdus arenilitoris]|uniref:DNA ligase (ATP) n=1 Tax=Sphingorhabdus arenilitoris TaxID=1490041 RepID=A0ABV8RH73_9SPHN